MTKRSAASAAKSQEAQFIDQLYKTLSTEEIQHVLAGSLLALDRAGRARLLDRLDPDTRSVLASLLDVHHTGRAAPPCIEPHERKRRGAGRGDAFPGEVQPGKARIRENWQGLWSEWNECVEESGADEGRYAQQDHHWEQPYFDNAQLSDDLESIASRLHALMPRVLKLDLDPALSFAQEIRRLDEDAGPGTDGGVGEAADWLWLGAETTRCVLDWELARGRSRGLGPFQVLDALCKLDTGFVQVRMLGDTVCRYAAGLPDSDQRAVVDGIAKCRATPHWASALQQPRTTWFQLALELSRRHSPAVFAELCRSNVAHDWRLVLPLLRDCLKRKDHRTFGMLIDEAFRAMLGPGDAAPWDPRATLLARNGRYRYDDNGDRDAAALLDLWSKVAAASADRELLWALELQKTVLQSPGDADAAIRILRAARTPELESVRNRLVSDWSNLIADDTLGLPESGLSTSSDAAKWVHGLVDGSLEDPPKPARLHAAVRAMVREAATLLARPGYHPVGSCSARFAAPHADLRSFARLTIDLDSKRTLNQRFPVFRRLLEDIAGTDEGRFGSWRRRALAGLRGGNLLPLVIRAWQENVENLVPEPGGSGSDYTLCANWLAAVDELDGAGADRILSRWEERHPLKRNLWKAIAHRKMAVSSGVRRA